MGYYLSLLLYRLLFNIMIVLFLGGNEELVASLVELYHDVYNLAILYLMFSFTLINTHDALYLSPHNFLFEFHLKVITNVC